MISTTDLSGLPDVPTLRRLMQSLATLEAMLSPEWETRYYSFDSRWAPGETMGSMRNGTGDQWFALFCRAGAAIVGLDHESVTYTPGAPRPWVFRDLPKELHRNVLQEPAFDTGNVTFCAWRLAGDTRWSCGAPRGCRDGSAGLLAILDGSPAGYLDFARWYHGRDLALDDVATVYRHEPITPTLLERLSPSLVLETLREDLDEIGYPA